MRRNDESNSGPLAAAILAFCLIALGAILVGFYVSYVLAW